MDPNLAALIVAALSFATSLWALHYARLSARSADEVAKVEHARFLRETDQSNSAELVMVEAPDRDMIQVSNDGQHIASDLRLTYPGLRFQTLMEDDDSGLSLAPGETVEFIPLIDWDHPHNQHMHDREREGHMGVPGFPLYLGWTDGRGTHHERRRVRRRARIDQQ